jgi:uncharacterized protein
MVRSGDRTPVPWKNGQGSTREIARRLLGIRGPRFVWRVSISDLVRDADLATFPGVERSVTVVAGEGAGLVLPGAEHHLVPNLPFRFDGEAQAHVRLPHGPVSILNVLTVTNRMSAEVRIHNLSTDVPLTIAGTTLVVLLSGAASVYAADGAHGDLAPLDALVARPRVRVVSGSGRVAVVRMVNYQAWRAFSW